MQRSRADSGVEGAHRNALLFLLKMFVFFVRADSFEMCARLYTHTVSPHDVYLGYVLS